MMLPPPLEPGIYFGLDENVYHADRAISRSNIVDVLDTPNTYWKNSWMNPERKAGKMSDPMKYGSAFDCLMFEPKLFEQKYQVVPIDTWAEDKIKISYEDYFKIVNSIKVLRAGKDSRLFLSGGMPQVTIVFDWRGRRYRTRHDYFTPVQSADFKTTRSLKERHLKSAFDEYGYDIQLALYRMSRKIFKEQFLAGKANIYGNVDPMFFDRFMADEINEFTFIFQRSSAPFPFEALFPEDDTENSGIDKIIRADAIFEKNLTRYGLKEWPVCEGKLRGFSMFYGFKE